MSDMLVNIDVDDIEAAERFYCAAFALRPARRFGKDAVELIGTSSKLYLLAKAPGTQAAPGADQARSYTRHWTPVHLDFVVDDLEQAVSQSLAAGATQEQAIRDNAWGRIAVMADPFGHGYCLIEFTAAGYDAVAT
ncbi:VOC family protein [Xanthomonas axonopodis pv. poinsettiicola]|uniref:VOC family protein n=1 Tax=Xanthomonas TaxID=338 RepID=UPI001E608A9B|nr:VOC family protein [Xanthomonas codiaei]MCC8537047.1 VOC family protein [Xanthomonas codiaei]